MPLAVSVITVAQWLLTGAAVSLLLASAYAAFGGRLPFGLPSLLVPKSDPEDRP